MRSKIQSTGKKQPAVRTKLKSKTKKLIPDLNPESSEMQTLLEFGQTLNKQKELLNKVLRFHKADKKSLEKAVKDRTKQFEEKNTELKIANKALAFQNKEKEKRAAELGIANKELTFQNKEKEKRAAELGIANKELAFQNNEKEKRAAELSIANQDLTSFTYISSHDLQEPLRKIQNFATILLQEEENNLSDSGKDYFTRMMATANRMQNLIEDLLTYSRTKSGENVFVLTDLNKLVQEVEKDLENVILQKKGIIKTKLHSINVIPFQFRQLLHNLIGNSLKFSKKNEAPLITLTSKIAKGNKLNNKYLLPKKEYCHISVSDNGIGFDPQYKDRIFEVFQRLHSAQAYHGTGIGLAICKRIVENHKGIITATGQLDKGAKFDIYISTD